MFVKNENTKSQNAGNGVTRKILGRGGSLMMVEVKFDKNAIGDPHTHPHEQVSYIASGSFEFTLEGEKQILKKGDSVYIPANAIHETVALEDDSIILDVFTPQREDFL
ncbi:MAG: cupin domain-containing protein [Clostridiaceae bacterium]|jgi:quercetin dioxygenase-like cupin family protein|nr:cupin domain-containing protein [Clostridiaceae bacterium]